MKENLLLKVLLLGLASLGARVALQMSQILHQEIHVPLVLQLHFPRCTNNPEKEKQSKENLLVWFPFDTIQRDLKEILSTRTRSK